MTGKEISYRKAIGLQVKIQLVEKRLSQETAAKRAGLTPTQVGAIVNGRSNYTIDSLTQLVESCSLDIRVSLEIFEDYKLIYG